MGAKVVDTSRASGASVGSESSLTENVGSLQPLRDRKGMFAALCIINILINFDAGAIAANVTRIMAEMNMSFARTGSLASMTYLGLCVGSFSASPLFKKYHTRRVIAYSMIANVIANIMFAISPDANTMMLSRLCIGITQAPMVVYMPVWVHEFSPEAKSTIWMGIIQAGVPIGITLGYIIAGALTTHADVDWRVPFYVQVGALFLPVLSLFFVPHRLLDLDQQFEEQSEELTQEHKQNRELYNMSLFQQAVHVLKDGMYIGMVLCLCTVYFVVTGIQLWVTPYLETYVEIPRAEVIYSFSFVSATAPIGGVIFGGWFMDRLGGYAGAQVAVPVGTVFGLALAACACTVPALLVMNLIGVVIGLWGLLFFGGSVVPIATGLIINSAPRAFRSMASSVSAVFLNIFGFFLGPFLCGLAAQIGGGVEWAYRLALIWACLGVFFSGVALIIARGRYAFARSISDFSAESTEVWMDTSSDKAVIAD
eukprot:Clim_evm15s220 gene=Clim_evmTU15s220